MAEAQDILRDGEVAVVLAKAVAGAVEIAKCAVDEAERVWSKATRQQEHYGEGGNQGEGAGGGESSTGSYEGGPAGADGQ